MSLVRKMAMMAKGRYGEGNPGSPKPGGSAPEPLFETRSIAAPAPINAPNVSQGEPVLPVATPAVGEDISVSSTDEERLDVAAGDDATTTSKVAEVQRAGPQEKPRKERATDARPDTSYWTVADPGIAEASAESSQGPLTFPLLGARQRPPVAVSTEGPEDAQSTDAYTKDEAPVSTPPAVEVDLSEFPTDMQAALAQQDVAEPQPFIEERAPETPVALGPVARRAQDQPESTDAGSVSLSIGSIDIQVLPPPAENRPQDPATSAPARRRSSGLSISSQLRRAGVRTL